MLLFSDSWMDGPCLYISDKLCSFYGQFPRYCRPHGSMFCEWLIFCHRVDFRHFTIQFSLLSEIDAKENLRN